MLAAAKDESVPLLAAVLLAGNSRRGFATSTNELHRAFGFANSNTATGLRVCLYDEGRGSRCTGRERDSESGLDYFGARYYGSALGRFSSADEPLIDQEPGDPQSWNLYGYVRNNPLKNVDPFGLDCITTSNQSSSGISVTTERGGSADSCSGTYINGTVDTSSYSYNGSSLSFSDNTAGGGGAINLVSPSTPNDALSPDVANMLNRAGNMAAPGVNLAAGGLMIFGSVVAPLPMALAQYGAGNGSKFDLATALLPGGLGLLATEEKAIAGVLKQIASGTTKGKVFENFAGRCPPR